MTLACYVKCDTTDGRKDGLMDGRTRVNLNAPSLKKKGHKKIFSKSFVFVFFLLIIALIIILVRTC
jgi:hypothetical protein